MASDSWINETLYPDWGQRFLVKRELARVRSAFQDIVIFESFSHGRVMVLDGVIQITEADEFVYQEMLAHVPLLAHGAAENVLIIGAGDGGVLRRVLQHRTVGRAVMAEIDGEVIRLAREFMPAIGGDAWNDPRAEVIVGDGIDYVRRAPDSTFDAIIVKGGKVELPKDALGPCFRAGVGEYAAFDPGFDVEATRKVVANWTIPGGGSPDMGNVSADGKWLWL